MSEAPRIRSFNFLCHFNYTELTVSFFTAAAVWFSTGVGSETCISFENHLIVRANYNFNV